jgi:hypothetical protein
VPTTVDDAAWDGAPELLLPLTGQAVFAPRWQTPSVDAVAVQALYDDETIAFRLTWHDRFHDTEDSGTPPELPSEGTTYVAPIVEYLVNHPPYGDRIEMQFPASTPDGTARPYFIYGTEGEPVTLWRWEAATGDAQELTQAGARAAPEAQADDGQELLADAGYADGRYRLVLARPRTAADGDIPFPVGVPVPFAIHAWDGHAGETSWAGEEGQMNHLMSVSAWYHVVLPPETPSTVFLWTLVAVGLVAGAEWWVVRRLRGGRQEG